MKIIVFGCGKIGEAVISGLSGEGHDIVVIDKSPKIVDEISNIYDVMGVCGNGVDSDTMLEAGCDEAELFVAVTGSDEMNMLSCFLARKMGAKHTVARLRNPEYNDDSLVFIRQHLDISLPLNPDKQVAHEIFNSLSFPVAAKVDTFSGRNLEIIQLVIKEDSPFADKRLIDLRKNYDEKFLVCVVKRGDEVYIPDGNFTLKVGDKIGVTAAHTELQKLMKHMGMPAKMPKSVMIMGASRIAYYLSRILINSGVLVKVIDKNEEVCADFSARVPSAVMIAGDGMNPEVLLEEGLSACDAFVALTGIDEVNILSSFLASDNGVPTVIAKVNKPELAYTSERLGLPNTVSPQSTVSETLSGYARAIHNSLGSNVEALYRIMDGKAEVLEFKVADDFEYTDIPFRELKTKQGVLIAGIIRARKPIIPYGSDCIMKGDRVIVLTSGHTLDDLSDIIDS